MVVVLGVAERLAADPPPTGRVTFLFQPAEERPFGEPSGAAAVWRTALSKVSAPPRILGLHCWPELRAGSIGVDDRVAMGAKDAFRVRFVGRAAHAATPSEGRDAIVGISPLVGALHQGVARSLDPHEVAAFNVGTIVGGRSQSVVAPEAEVTGTLRTLNPAVRMRARAAVERATSGVATAFDLTPHLTWSDEMPPVNRTIPTWWDAPSICRRPSSVVSTW